MSELRDHTAALRSFDKRLTSIEECMLVVVRNSEQEAAAAGDLVRALKQVQEFQGSLWKYLANLDEKLAALAVTRVDDVKALNRRVGAIEGILGLSEVTRA